MAWYMMASINKRLANARKWSRSPIDT